MEDELRYSMVERQIDKMLQEFASLRDDYDAFSTQVASLLRAALTESEVRHLIVEHRAKDVESLKKKLSRPEKDYTALSEIPDLAGVRVIAFYQDDCVRIAELIKSEFLVVEEELSHQQEQLGSDKFGYISAHYVVKCSDSRKGLLEWKRSADLQCEIQIRTVIQHAWSAVSHELQYKADQVPSNLQRRLNRISGLFELADEEFVGIRTQKQKIDEETNRALRSKNAKVPLSISSVKKLSDQLVGEAGRKQKLRLMGYRVSDRFESEAASQVVALAELGGIKDLSELRRVVGEFDEAYMEEQFKADRKSDGWTVSPAFVLALHLMKALQGKVSSDFLVSLGWSRQIADRVLATAKKP